MTLSSRLALFSCLFSGLGMAGTWSGVLVDSGCWAGEQANTNRYGTSSYVDSDRNLELRFCAPKTKTKSFALVRADGASIVQDSAGDAKAQELVRTAGKQSTYQVVVNGNAVHVISITAAR